MYGHEIRDRCHVNFEANNLTFYARLLCAHLYYIFSSLIFFFLFSPAEVIVYSSLG